MNSITTLMLGLSVGAAQLLPAEISSTDDNDRALTIASLWPRAGYTIVVPQDAIASERYAAEELARFLAQSTSDVLPVVTDDKPLPEKAIVVGPVRQLQDLGVAADFDSLGKEGFVLKTIGDRLVILGGRPRGTLYGVYEIIYKYVGCRFFAPNETYVPTHKQISIAPLDEVYVPVFKERAVSNFIAVDLPQG